MSRQPLPCVGKSSTGFLVILEFPVDSIESDYGTGIKKGLTPLFFVPVK